MKPYVICHWCFKERSEVSRFVTIYGFDYHVQCARHRLENVNPKKAELIERLIRQYFGECYADRKEAGFFVKEIEGELRYYELFESHGMMYLYLVDEVKTVLFEDPMDAYLPMGYYCVSSERHLEDMLKLGRVAVR